MNKSAGVLLGIVVAIGAISAGGAWYTGTKLEGVLNTSISDAKLIADQATATADMFGSMAVGTQLAKLDGNNIVSTLHYANNQVEFNGQKMTVEEFVGFVMSKFGGNVAVE